MRWTLLVGTTLLGIHLVNSSVHGESPLTLENVVAPIGNSAGEPLASTFSAKRSAHFLDAVALDWTKRRSCFTCHTNYYYLMARPSLRMNGQPHLPVAHTQVRAALDALVEDRWPDKGPRSDAEVVMSAAILACNDAATTGVLQASTLKALDRMWTLQREDGGFDWLKCDWPPLESDDHYGVTMALIGVGSAPEDYIESEVARAGVARMRDYLAATPSPTLHHQAMVLWASTKVEGLIDMQQRSATIEQLLDKQNADGGWNLASLGNWTREDGSPQDLQSSDGYATGFVLYVLRQAGVSIDDPRVILGKEWLLTNQRETGRWYTRSLHRDGEHFISHAGTAMAVMALAACNAL